MRKLLFLLMIPLLAQAQSNQAGLARFSGNLNKAITNPLLTTADSYISFNTTPIGTTLSLAGSFDSTFNTFGNIFQIASQVISTSTAPAVGIYGSGIGNSNGSKIWGGNLAAIVNNAGSTGIALELDINMPTAGTGTGLAVDAVGANAATAGVQIQSNTIAGGFTHGLNFNNTTHTAVSGDLVRSLNSSATNGIDFSGTFSNSEITTPSFIVGATPAGINSAFNLLGSNAANPTLQTIGSATNITLTIKAKGTGTIQLNNAPQLNFTYSAAGTPLPTCTGALINTIAVVSDATAPTYRGAYASGGGQRTLVFCDGASWTTH